MDSFLSRIFMIVFQRSLNFFSEIGRVGYFTSLVVKVMRPPPSLRVCQVLLAIDGTASTVSLTQNVCVVLRVSVAVREGEECVQDFLDHLSSEKSAAQHFVLEGEADDNDSFVEIMSGITAVCDAESEGWTSGDALARANLSADTLAEGVFDTSRLLTSYSSFFIAH